jgi:hypothetical protein
MSASFSRLALFCGAGLATATCHAQAFNVDLEVFSGGEGIGAGAPSSSFGAAANQRGYWNAAGLLSTPWALRSLLGQDTAVSLTAEGDQKGDTGGFFFKGNTGDYARLLNDAQNVAPQVDGGSLACVFRGLKPGVYEIFTYAVSPIGNYVETPVYVPGGIGAETQVVTGPMPGNAFKYLITHSIHLVDIDPQEDLRVEFYQDPNADVQYVNGFQIVPVPEVPGLLPVILGCAVLVIGRRRIS